MQDDDFNQDGPDVHVLNDRGPESRTTASEERSCEHCGRGLTGRKQRFCSDRCRMKDRRAREDERRSDLLARLKGAVNDLENDLTGQ